MLDNFFIKARPIYPNDLIKEMNISLFFTNDIFLEKDSLLKTEIITIGTGVFC